MVCVHIHSNLSRPLLLYLTYELVQIYITFNRTDVSFLNKLTSNSGKRIVLVFCIHCVKLVECQVIIFSFIQSCFSFFLC